MIVKSKIIADLTRPNFGGRVNAVQGDGNTRCAEITLQDGGKPWTPPEGVDVAIAYYQPSGHKGMYNKLADGSAAIAVSGNVATVILAPQMLTVSGTVQASLVFNDAQLNRLTTFPFSVSVASNPAAGAQKTEDYIRLQWLEDKLAEYLAEIKASGAFDGRPGDPGRDYDHSPEFTALAAEMAGYQQQVAEDRQQIADAAAAVDASAKAAAGSAGISAGAQQAAEGAATAAAKSAEDAERYAEESYLAVDSLRPVVSQIKSDLSDLTPAGAQVGQLFRVAAISEDGKYTMEPVDMLDVKIDGASIVQDGVANIPFATASQAGVAKFTENQGMRAYGKYVGLKPTTNNEINERYTIGNKGGAILTQNFDYAVKAAMCDGKGAVWTAEEQAAARERMGIPGDYELIADITLDEEIRVVSINFKEYLSEIYVVFSGTSTGSGNSTIDVVFDDDTIRIYAACCSGWMNTSKRYAYAHISLNQGILCSESMGTSSNDTWGVNSIYTNGSGLALLTETQKSIKAINIKTLNNNNWCAGCKFTVYGVRA